MALQNLCLTAIVEDFERYYTAFSTSENANLKRMFEFLQRVYSFEIATQLYENVEMEEKYTDFLINKYLKILDTNWFNNCTWKTIVTKMADVGPNIKKMYFHECSKDRFWQEIFCYLPNLEVMHFHRHCINEILSSLAKYCPNIIEIDIRSSYNVTEEGLKTLCKKKNGKVSCPKLKNLVLKSCEVTEAVAIYLIKNLPSLEVFDYFDLPVVLYSMHKEDLAKIDKISPYNFNKLDFFSSSLYPYFTDILKVCLSICPFITTLSCPVLETQHLDLLSRLSYLETLHLEWDQNDYLDINHLLKSKGSKLTSLTICKCSLSVLTLAESCPSLKLLSMNSVNFKQHDGSIPLFHNLNAFTVEETDICNNASNLKSVCLILSSSPKLDSITFEQCNLTTSEIKAEILKCSEHCCVKKIDFDSSSVDKQFVIDILLTCRSLESFNLEGCGLTNYDETEISRCIEMLPNNPDVYFSEQLSSVYDDFFDDYYDNDLDEVDDYDDEDDDYVYDDDDDDDEVYGYFYQI